MAEDMKTQVTIALDDQFTAPLKGLLDALKTMTENTVRLSEQVGKVSAAMDSFQTPLNEVKSDIKEALKPLEQMAKDNKELKDSVKTASKQLEAGNGTLKHMASAMEGSCKSADHLEREMTELKSVNAAQAQQITALQSRLNDLAEAHRRAAEEAKKQKDAENTLEKKLENVKNLAQGAGQVLQSTGQIMQGMGAAMAAPAAAVAAVGFGAAQESMSTDWAATRLGNTFTNAQAANRESNLKDAKKLALELAMKYPGSTEDVLAAMASMAEMGMEFESIKNGGANSAVQFASMFNMGFEDAGRAMVQFGNQLGVDVGNKEQGEKMVDELQRLRAVTGADAGTLLETFKYLAPTLNTLGQQGLDKTRETTAILAMLNKTSMGGSMAGTNYGELLSHTAALETTMGRKRFQKIYGQTIAEHGIALQFFDQAGKFKGQREMIKELGKLNVLSEQEQLNITKQLFGETGGRVASILAMQGVEKYDKTRKYMDDQLDAQTSLNNIMDTYKTKFETLQASMASIKVIVGDYLLDGVDLRSTITSITNLISDIGRWLQTTDGQQLLQDVLSPLKKIPEYIDLALSKLSIVGEWIKKNPKNLAWIGKMLLTITGVAVPLGGIIATIGTGLVAAGAALGSIGGLVTAIAGVWSFVSGLSTPVIIAVAAAIPAMLVAATEAGAAFWAISKLIYNHWEGIKSFAAGFLNGLTGNFDYIAVAAKRVQVAFSPVLDMILQAIDWLLGTSSADSAANSLANGYAMGDTFGKIVELVLLGAELAGKFAQAIFNNVKRIIDFIGTVISLFERIKAKLIDIGSVIDEFLVKRLEGPIRKAKVFLDILRKIGILQTQNEDKDSVISPQAQETKPQGIFNPKKLFGTLLPSRQPNSTVNNTDYSKTNYNISITSGRTDSHLLAREVVRQTERLRHEQGRKNFGPPAHALV